MKLLLILEFYSIQLLKKLPFNELNAQGYSLGVRLVWLMKKLNANLIEVPIHLGIEIKENQKYQNYKFL